MHKLAVLIPILLFLGCGEADPVEEVRKQRRKIDLKTDLTVSTESVDATYVIKAQNLNSGAVLREITVIFEILDDQDQVVWEKQHELDITGLGNYATKDFNFKEPLPQEAVDKLANVEFYGSRAYPAPDVEGDDWKKYNEFRRVVRE